MSFYLAVFLLCVRTRCVALPLRTRTDDALYSPRTISTENSNNIADFFPAAASPTLKGKRHNFDKHVVQVAPKLNPIRIQPGTILSCSPVQKVTEGTQKKKYQPRKKTPNKLTFLCRSRVVVSRFLWLPSLFLVFSCTYTRNYMLNSLFLRILCDVGIVLPW